jgi:hypothetical protein
MNPRSFTTWIVAALIALAAVLAFPGAALADKLHLKDGRVLDGKIVREGEKFVFFRFKIGNISQEQMFTMEQIARIERDDPAPKTDEAIKAEQKKDEAAAKTDKHTGATRMAILNFGPPQEWGEFGNTVGLEISVDAFRRAVPLLEKAKVDVVVIRVNSGGGLLLETPRFMELFETVYKPKFRTVAWIQSAISAAAMSPWVLEEFYFYRKGNMGACTAFSGRLNAVKGYGLEAILADMESASVKGKRDPKIMRAMQIMEPLSVDIDEAGNVVWRQDENGQHVLNRADQVFTINANDAIRFRFARGIADTKEELVQAMGLQEVEWVAQDATALIDKSLRDNDRANKEFNEIYTKYAEAKGIASQLPDKQRRGMMVNQARQHLATLRRMVGLNPNYPLMYGTDNEWFANEDRDLREIAARP